MTTDLEQGLRDDLNRAAQRFPAPPDLREQVSERVAAGSRRRVRPRAVAAVALVVLAMAGAAALATTGDGPSGSTRVIASPPTAPAVPTGWVADVEPDLGWSYDRPADWLSQRYERGCRVSAVGTVVTNLPEPLLPQSGPNLACSTGWTLARVPANFVGVEMSRFQGGAFGAVTPNTPRDTLFPLSPAALKPAPAVPNEGSPDLASRSIAVQVDGDSRYNLRIWTGTDPAPEDVAAAERIVTSVRLTADPTDGPPPLPRACPAGVTEPTFTGGQLCIGEAPAGNGLGPDGACTGRETAPPCGPGAGRGRYYPYTLPLRCDGVAHFDGRTWISQLPPPSDGGAIRVWMRLTEADSLGFVSPRGAVSFRPDTGEPRRTCR